MIIGIGIDLVEIERVRNIMQRFGDRFARRVLSESELAEYFQSPGRAGFLAKRFAAKEAFSKALGTGIGGAVTLRGISVRHNEGGMPRFDLDAGISNIISGKGVLSCHLSLTDEKQHAMACVILES